jgi:hypothetical protein
VLRPTSKKDYESEFASGEEASGMVADKNDGIRISTIGPSADVRVFCVGGGDGVGGEAACVGVD